MLLNQSLWLILKDMIARLQQLLLSKNLDDSEFSLSANDINSDDICLYAAEKDIDIEFDLFAGKGSDKGNFVGGEEDILESHLQ